MLYAGSLSGMRQRSPQQAPCHGAGGQTAGRYEQEPQGRSTPSYMQATRSSDFKARIASPATSRNQVRRALQMCRCCAATLHPFIQARLKWHRRSLLSCL